MKHTIFHAEHVFKLTPLRPRILLKVVAVVLTESFDIGSQTAPRFLRVASLGSNELAFSLLFAQVSFSTLTPLGIHIRSQSSPRAPKGLVEGVASVEEVASMEVVVDDVVVEVVKVLEVLEVVEVVEVVV